MDATYLGEADEVYARYGFSQFTLTTERGAYAIGRLGSSYFRSPAALLDDEAAHVALRRLDPHRRVLCIDGPEWWEAASERGAVLLGRTVRLQAPIEQVVARLDRVLSASGSESVSSLQPMGSTYECHRKETHASHVHERRLHPYLP